MVTAEEIKAHLASCMLHVYTRRPCVEWTEMRRNEWQTHVSTDTFVEMMLGHLGTFRRRHGIHLTANRLLQQRPATHDKIVDFLCWPDWNYLEHVVPQACWNSSQFGPSAMHHVLSRLQRFVLFFEVWFCYCLIGIFVRAVA